MQDNNSSQSPQQQVSSPPTQTGPLPPPLPIDTHPSGLRPPKRRAKRWLLWIGVSIFGALLVSTAGAALWYNVQLSPVGDDPQQLVAVTIEPGMNPNQIAELLHDQGVIRSTSAFEIHARIAGIRGQLQAGAYRLSPSESTPQIAAHLVSGKVDQFSITFLPGATLADHRKVFVDAGFDETAIDQAFARSYDSALFDGMPAGADLEGYIYGETYQFSGGVTVEGILERTFEEFLTVINDNDLIDGFKSQNLSLHEGITLASIIQREVKATPDGVPSTDQSRVAQVFYYRLNNDMPLGSDVTFIYAANKLGVTPISTLESDYNTRIVKGLPPGPIASPGISALRATAAPAEGTDVYFVAGEDGKTYFGKTLEEHEVNVARYCGAKCDKP